MNNLFVSLGIEPWKPLLTALALPPVPLLLMLLAGAGLIPRRRRWGWFVVLTGIALLWLTACIGTARLLLDIALHPPTPLTAKRVAELRRDAAPATAIVVLGGGAEPLAPEYAASSLQSSSMERLRYGIWLSRATQLPLAYSGGAGWAQSHGPSEARIAARIAANEFGHRLTWVEEAARDTRENAVRSVALLRPAGVRHILLVTNDWHMPRALRDFRSAAGSSIRIEAAPLGTGHGADRPVLDWMPSARGTTEVRQILRELLGSLAGA